MAFPSTSVLIDSVFFEYKSTFFFLFFPSKDIIARYQRDFWVYRRSVCQCTLNVRLGKFKSPDPRGVRSRARWKNDPNALEKQPSVVQISDFIVRSLLYNIMCTTRPYRGITNTTVYCHLYSDHRMYRVDFFSYREPTGYC